MSWTKKIKHPSKLLEVGQEIECQVLEVDARAKRISLGLKQLEPDPWSIFTDKYKPGDKVGGKVRSITDYGVFVGIEDGVDGMVHKTDLSWTTKVNHPQDMHQKGDDVEAIILSINHDEKKVSLGIKQIWDDPWGDMLSRFLPGTVVEEVAVISVAEYGAFVRVVEGVEALIPNNDIPTEMKLRRGDLVKGEIANVDSMDRRLTMSLKEVGSSPAAEQLTTLKKESAAASKGSTLGDLLKEKFGDKLSTLAAGGSDAAESEANEGAGESAGPQPSGPEATSEETEA
jgi:small subunit ribosomal protein S1